MKFLARILKHPACHCLWMNQGITIKNIIVLNRTTLHKLMWPFIPTYIYYIIYIIMYKSIPSYNFGWKIMKHSWLESEQKKFGFIPRRSRVAAQKDATTINFIEERPNFMRAARYRSTHSHTHRYTLTQPYKKAIITIHIDNKSAFTNNLYNNLLKKK